MSTTEYVSQLYKYLKWLCEKVHRKILLLIDLCKCNGNDDEVTMELADLARLLPYKNLQVVVTFTSASGKFINNEYVYSSIQNVIYEPGVNFHGFNGLEATEFQNLNLGKLKSLQDLTHHYYL